MLVKKVIQQTRHYDSNTDTTSPLRTKEEAHDYRYFPDPDLVPMQVDSKIVNEIASGIPELPSEKIKRYIRDYGLSEYDSRFLASDRKIASYFEQCVSRCKNAKAISNWLMGDFAAFLNKDGVSIDQSRVKPEMLCSLIEMVDSDKISAKIAKSVFEQIYENGTDPDEIIKNSGLTQISDEGQLVDIINKVIDENPGPVGEYKSGKEKAIGFLIGRIMAQTQGKANPKLVNKILKEKLK